MDGSGSAPRGYVLGIDLGAASVGWAAVTLNQGGMATGVLRAGVRVFDPAVTGDIKTGKDESNAVARRTARLTRRQLRRRAARQNDLFRLLQSHGLLPSYEGAEADGSYQRHSILNSLDRMLADKWAKPASPWAQAAIELPLYLLRKTALDQALEPFEIGRILYHLSQRRGYRSNRKEQPHAKKAQRKAKDADDHGAVEGGIRELEDAMRAAGARTLGEYLLLLDPHSQKVRRRWTDRKMYEDEFAAIWAKQATFSSTLLTEKLHLQIKYLLFHQRPMKAKSHLIGECELEPGERRAAWATLEAQQIRVLQKVNELEMILPGNLTSIPLTPEQQQTVLNLLENSADVRFDNMRKALKLDKGIKFNLERFGEKKLAGNLTNTHMTDVFGDRWSGMSEADKKQAVEDWRNIEQKESLIRRAIEYWKLDEPGAERLASRPVPNGYCSFSRKAIRKILPLMKAGKQIIEAEKEIYGNRLPGGQVYDRIPPVHETLKTLRNPALLRALTELRKVINALVREHGKPTEVRIELSRELKRTRHERAKAAAQNQKRERQRNAARAMMLKELGPEFEHPSRAEMEKALLWLECQGECPYTGKRFPFALLFGENPPMRVKHIIPLSRIPDDSFQNKTLCCQEENQRHGNRTPFEAYTDPTEYQAILNRVSSWQTPNLGKQRRFELRTWKELEAFLQRQLNDTRYASKLACDLLGTLYGGRDIWTESGSRQVVVASSGRVTATLRKCWGLESILREALPSANGQNRGRPRSDHRHHAIDAITIALSRPRTVAALIGNNTEEHYWPKNGHASPEIQSPWKGFLDSIRPHVLQMLVSHRPKHRLAGPLHDETNYGRPHQEGGKVVVHIRKQVAGLSAADIENIVDPAVRKAIRAKAAQFGGALKMWTPREGDQDWPLLETRTGKEIPIKRVRIKRVLAVETIATGQRARHVALASNHHVAFFALLDGQGNERRWESVIVSQLEAMERKRKGQAIVETRYLEGGNSIFKFSLMGGDTVLLHKECDHKNDLCHPTVWRLRAIGSNGSLSLVPISDARLQLDIKKAKQWWSPTQDALRKLGAVKVVIDSLGRIHHAGG